MHERNKRIHNNRDSRKRYGTKVSAHLKKLLFQLIANYLYSNFRLGITQLEKLQAEVVEALKTTNKPKVTIIFFVIYFYFSHEIKLMKPIKYINIICPISFTLYIIRKKI